MFVIILLSVLFTFATALNESSICTDYVQYTTQINVTEQESYLVTKKVWCLKLPFRCPKQHTVFRTVTKLRTVPKVREVKKCCPGYRIEIGLEVNHCVPECSKPCINGKCISPEQCQCNDGYIGDTCDTVLQPPKCGECHNNSICDPNSGVCQCSSGWTGQKCNIPCKKGHYGINCNETCSQEICDHVTGKNECRDGYVGVQCEHLCPAQTYGKNCSESCMCKNDALCNHVSGKCHCVPGWTGTYCNIPCPPGKYGAHCLHDCSCQNGAICSPIDGECRCTPGWKGKFCTNKCSYGYYGEHCATPCSCKSETFICDHLEGCICPDNFTGELCDVSVLDVYYLRADTITELSESDTTMIVLYVIILLVIIILIVLITGVVIYKRKRRNRDDGLKYNVTFSASAVENMYSEPGNVLNNRIVNDLGATTRPDDANVSNYEENEYCEPLMKNLNADLDNPNINRVNISTIPEESEPDVEYENTGHISRLNKSIPPAERK